LCCHFVTFLGIKIIVWPFKSNSLAIFKKMLSTMPYRVPKMDNFYVRQYSSINCRNTCQLSQLCASDKHLANVLHSEQAVKLTKNSNVESFCNVSPFNEKASWGSDNKLTFPDPAKRLTGPGQNQCLGNSGIIFTDLPPSRGSADPRGTGSTRGRAPTQAS
jgi:hypothetical protein